MQKEKKNDFIINFIKDRHFITKISDSLNEKFRMCNPLDTEIYYE